MASKRSSRGNQKGKPVNPLAQFGIPDIPSFDDNDADEDDADGDLESELQALLSGRNIAKPPKAPKQVPTVMDVEKLAADCLKDIPDDGDDGDDGSVSGDEELLAELHALTSDKGSALKKPPLESTETSNTPSVSVSLLEERLNLYKEAVAAAKQYDDNSRVRRYQRAVKTLENMLSSAKSGHIINEKDVPPVVSVPKPKPTSGLAPSHTEVEPIMPSEPSVPPKQPPQLDTEYMPMETNIPQEPPNSELQPSFPRRPAPPVPAPSAQLHSEGSAVRSQLILRRDQYKVAALKAKRYGDTETALRYVKIAKKFDAVIDAERNGQPVDLTDMPPPPPECTVSANGPSAHPPATEEEKTQTSGISDLEAAALEAAKEPDPSLFNAPPPPTTILEALEQRLEKYCATRDAAKAEGNSSKARRLQRIVKQYEGAIKSYKAGKPVAFEDLPTPPGFAPIPVASDNTAVPHQSASTKPVVSDQEHPHRKPVLSQPEPAQKPSLPSSQKAVARSPENDPGTQPPEEAPQSGRHPRIQRANTSSILDKQLRFLLERQKLFRQAALESKKKGDIQQAKEYLRMSKGFDSMIEATKNGLPIDATTIPTPPQLEAEYVIIDASDCTESNVDGTDDELFENLEKELQRQIEMCTRNKEHFMQLGDVTSASKFEKLGLDTKKDLAFIQHLWRSKERVPLFHYETRLFSLVQCNTELADNELEVSVERGISLPGKSDDLDSYVRLEFAIPPENPQKAKTHTVRDTINPFYQEAFKFEINRKSRSQMRQFKKQVLKFEVFAKGWFFRGDALLGTVNLKLTDLETKCTLHDSFDLMDGRKPCGGKLEIKVRVRDPLLVKQVEEVREKWLVIGS